MKREIKFRAWNGKEMIQPKSASLIMGTKNWVFTKTSDIKGDRIYSDSAFGQKYDNSLMQYTGLKDKNGKEIFEGDIVSIYDIYNKTFSKDGAPVFFNNGYVGGWVIGDIKQFVSLGARDTNHIMVIGNIHENKNLLNETT